MRILYLIADLYDGDAALKEALEAGVDYVQLREKNITSARYLEDAVHVRELTDHYNKKYGRNTVFIVNDRVDIALLSAADGVHLGSDDIPVLKARRFFENIGTKKYIIGATAKTVEQARAAQRDGADYLGTGAFYATDTKPDAVPITAEEYTRILESVNIPDLAIGGITADNCALPLSCGADGIAVSAGILRSGNIRESIMRFRKILNS